MAVEFTQAVWDLSPYGKEKLVVLLALADWANREGVISASYNAIADKARIDRRSAIRIVNQLIADKIILKLSSNGTSHFQFSTTYQQAAKELRAGWFSRKQLVTGESLPSDRASDTASDRASDTASDTASDRGVTIVTELVTQLVTGESPPSDTASDPESTSKEIHVNPITQETSKTREAAHARDAASAFLSVDETGDLGGPERLPGEIDEFEETVAAIACESSSHYRVKQRVVVAASEIRADGFGLQDLQDFRAQKGAVALNFLPRELRIWREKKRANGAIHGNYHPTTPAETNEQRKRRELAEYLGVEPDTGTGTARENYGAGDGLTTASERLRLR